MFICVQCQSLNTRKNGKTKLGYQRYRCNKCGKGWSDNPKGKGRPTVNTVAMSNAERQQRYRKAQKSQ